MKKNSMESEREGNIQPLALKKPSENLEKAESAQGSLSVSVVKQLVQLMENVVKKEVTPQTVNAACNCANAIHKMILLNLSLAKGKR